MNEGQSGQGEKHGPGQRRKTIPSLPPMMNVEEEEENFDHLRSLPQEGVDFGHDRSVSNVGKIKADKMLGLDPDRHLATMYLISGPPKVS